MLEKRLKLTSMFHGYRDEIRAVETRMERRLQLQDMIALHSQLQEPKAMPDVPGASRGPIDWEEIVSVCLQLANLGMVADAREVISREDIRQEFLPGNPPRARGASWISGPTEPSAQEKLTRGCRALECALVHCEIAKASRYEPGDVLGARNWFEVAIAWLPDEQDISVLLRWTEFERRVNDPQSSSRIEDNLKQAKARVESLRKGGAPSLERRLEEALVFVQLAECAMDRLATEPSSWPGAPVGSQVQAESAPPPSPQAYLNRAQECLDGLPKYFGDSLGSVDDAQRLQLRLCAPVHFRIQCALAKLYVKQRDIDDALDHVQKALGEPGPSARGVLRPEQDPTGGKRPRLTAGWSRLLGCGANFSVEDLRTAEGLRRQWVELLVAQARAQPGGLDSTRAQADWEDAAHLLCRYWARSDEPRLTEDIIDLDWLRRLTHEVLSVWEPAVRKLAETDVGPSGLDYLAEGQDFTKLDVVNELRRRVSPVPPPAPPLAPPSPPAAPARSPNIMCHVVAQPAAPYPIVDEIRIFDVGVQGAASDLDGYSVSIELGDGQFVRRHGVFGYPMGHVYSERLKPSRVLNASEAFGGAQVFGKVCEVGRLSFEGLASFGPRFSLVIRDGLGNEWSRHDLANFSVLGSAPPNAVRTESLAQSRAKIAMIFAVLAADSHSRNGEREAARVLLKDLVECFESELGAARAVLQSQLGHAHSSTSSAFSSGWASAASAPESAPPLIDHKLLEGLWDSMVGAHPDASVARRHEEATQLLNQLPVDLREAMVRLIHRYAKSNPGRLQQRTIDAILAKPADSPAVQPAPPAAAALNRTSWQASSAPASQAQPLTSDAELEFKRQKSRLNAEGLTKVWWLFEKDPAARRGVLSDMIDTVEREVGKSAQRDPPRSARLDGILRDLAAYRQRFTSGA